MFSFTDQSEVGLLVGIFNGSSGFPIGTQNWFLTKKCDNVKQELEPTMLKLSQVIILWFLLLSQGLGGRAEVLQDEVMDLGVQDLTGKVIYVVNI